MQPFSRSASIARLHRACRRRSVRSTAHRAARSTVPCAGFKANTSTISISSDIATSAMVLSPPRNFESQVLAQYRVRTRPSRLRTHPARALPPRATLLANRHESSAGEFDSRSTSIAEIERCMRRASASRIRARLRRESERRQLRPHPGRARRMAHPAAADQALPSCVRAIERRCSMPRENSRTRSFAACPQPHPFDPFVASHRDAADHRARRRI